MLSNGERAQRYAAVERVLATPMLVLSLLIIPVLLLPLAWPSMPAACRFGHTGKLSLTPCA